MRFAPISCAALGALCSSCAITAPISASAASFTLDPNDPHQLINDGAYVDGTRADQQSTFSKEIASSGKYVGALAGWEKGSGTVLLGDVPVESYAGDLFFVFVYDQQEVQGTGGESEPRERIYLEQISILIDSIPVWEWDHASYGTLALMGNTDSPLGNGADMGLAIPLALVASMGQFTGSSQVTFSWTQSGSHNGGDEWVLVGDGYFGPDQPVVSRVPLPGALPLMALATGALFGGAALRRRGSEG